MNDVESKRKLQTMDSLESERTASFNAVQENRYLYNLMYVLVILSLYSYANVVYNKQKAQKQYKNRKIQKKTVLFKTILSSLLNIT